MIGAGNRKGLERLSRYVLRPPLAKTRLEERKGGLVVVALKQPWADGTTAPPYSRASHGPSMTFRSLIPRPAFARATRWSATLTSR